jgi:hypothetical protein
MATPTLDTVIDSDLRTFTYLQALVTNIYPQDHAVVITSRSLRHRAPEPEPYSAVILSRRPGEDGKGVESMLVEPFQGTTRSGALMQVLT